MAQAIKAAILNQPDGNFTLESLTINDPLADEILVRVVATGICHTDIKVSQGYGNVPLPVVLGHEGAGVVVKAGKHVTTVKPGDHVIMTFPSCGNCRQCLGNHPAYCDDSQTLSFSCRRSYSQSPYIPETIHGYFFGQSSFASHAMTSPRNVVKVDKSLPLEQLGALGCGFQTGAGAVLNVMQPAPAQSLAVFGAGNVGLSAVMAARIAGMDPVIAVDSNPARLALAAELGATDTIDTGNQTDPVAAILAATSGAGVDFSLDTTNIPEVVRKAFECLANRGTCIHSGGGGKDLCFPGSHLLHGRTVIGVIQGDSNPQEFIPRLLEYHHRGIFPFDRLLTFYPLAQINEAIAAMAAGQVVKPVLRMPEH